MKSTSIIVALASVAGSTSQSSVTAVDVSTTVTTTGVVEESGSSGTIRAASSSSSSSANNNTDKKTNNNLPTNRNNPKSKGCIPKTKVRDQPPPARARAKVQARPPLQMLERQLMGFNTNMEVSD